jgi:hypothetical protein
MIAAQIDIDVFSKAVDVMSRLKAKGVLDLSFGVGRMSLGGDEELSDEMLKEFNLSEELFGNIVSEILMISHNILGGNKNNLISKLKSKDKYIKEKVDLLEHKFLDNKLRAKFLLNIGYKTNILDKFDWEIIRKYHKDYPKQLNEIPIAIMRFRIKHPFSDIPPVEKTETFIFETIPEEIDELISELNEIKNQFHKISRREESNV